MDPLDDPQYKRPHLFKEKHFSSPTFCLACKEFIWGLGRQGCKCQVCGYVCHKRCVEKVQKFQCYQYLKAKRKQSQIVKKGASSNQVVTREAGGHDFAAKHFSKPTMCEVCNDMIYGLGKQGLGCTLCKKKIHYRCLGSVKWQVCPRSKQERAPEAKRAMNRRATKVFAPPGFEYRVDETTGGGVYFEQATGRIYRDLPDHIKHQYGAVPVLHSVKLPDGWEMRLENLTEEVFYVDHNTQTTSWDPPNVPGSSVEQKDPSPYLTLEQQQWQLELQARKYEKMRQFYGEVRANPVAYDQNGPEIYPDE